MNAALFDMDGLLLDTEPSWGVVMKAKAEAHGIVIPMNRVRETAGLRIIEVCYHWQRNFPWPENLSPEALSEEIIDGVIARSKEEGSVLPGVLSLLQDLQKEGWKIGLASSSPLRMIEDLLEHFEMTPFFEAVVSADTAALGKPHPEVYLQCAQQLGVGAHQCVVLEDTVNGCIAAKAARMKTLAVPHREWANDPRFAIADRVVSSLEGVNAADLEMLLKG